jgi:urea transport system substrate-binding protein
MVTGITRRAFMATTGATAISAFAMPSIAAGKTIKVGAVQPFSGGLELFGNQAKMGLDLAVSEINSAGGILGHPVELIYEDNKTDPKTSVERAKKLILKDEVIAVSGPITSAARDAMVQTVERGKTPLLYATNYEGGMCNDYLFSFNTVPNQDTAPLIPYLKDVGIGDSYYMFGADYVWR